VILRFESIDEKLDDNGRERWSLKNIIQCCLESNNMIYMGES
jgi:hypothetical protein